MRLLFSTLFVWVVAGCISAGPQLSVDRGTGAPTGGPGGSPAGIPSSNTNMQFLGSGAGLTSSENFRGFGSTTYLFGGRMRGEVYQLVSPEMSLAQRKAGNSQ